MGPSHLNCLNLPNIEPVYYAVKNEKKIEASYIFWLHQNIYRGSLADFSIPLIFLLKYT